MALERIVKRLAMPLFVGALAMASLDCKESTKPEDEVLPDEVNLSSRQEELVKEGSTSASPRIRFTFVPAKGSYTWVQGRAYNVDPDSTKVTAYIQVHGTWWVKPYWAWPLTDLSSECRLKFDYTTGGIDQVAERINAYLVKVDFNSPYALPNMKDARVLAGVTVNRD